MLKSAGIYAGDLFIDQQYCMGDSGDKVVLIQEWLCLNGINILIDGIFGPATKRAVKIFQNNSEIYSDGIVGGKTFAKLIRPMTNALFDSVTNDFDLGQAVLAYAKKHLKNHPREVGGSNNGPWVRLYMDGLQGLPWCAGFVSFILRQASNNIGVIVPFETSPSCDRFVYSAKDKGLFREGRDIADKSKMAPGALFLCRKSKNDWMHIGIVTRAESEQFYTIEGNANDNGNRDGFEVCERIRSYSGKDFIFI